jgi:hypothetical protein
MGRCQRLLQMGRAAVAYRSGVGDSFSGVDGRLYPWGNEAPDTSQLNFNFNHNNDKYTTKVGSIRRVPVHMGRWIWLEMCENG